MNRDQIKKNLPTIQAFGEGKIIQYQHKLDRWPWEDLKDDANFNFDNYDYRVKPEPKMLFILKRGDGSQVGSPYTNKTKATHELDFYTTKHGAEWGPYSLEEYVQVVK